VLLPSFAANRLRAPRSFLRKSALFYSFKKSLRYTMSTSQVTLLSDTLPTTVPRLDPSGNNWTIFLFRFQDAVDAKGYWGHFDGTTPAPSFKDEDAAKAENIAAKIQWEKDELATKTLLT
jgi:hypothetical protein